MIQTDKGVITLGKELFWDIPASEISAVIVNSPEWVIPRVFEYGSLQEIADLVKLYGTEKSIEVVKRVSLKPMARTMAYFFLDVDLPKVEERPLFYK